MGKIIAVTSGKGGVGKTTCSGNTALALAALGKRVLAIDCDFGLRNLDLILKLTDQVVYTVADCVNGGMTAQEAAVQQGENLFFLASPFQYEDGDIEKEALQAFLQAEKDRYDFILLDTAAGILQNTRLALACADEVVIVATPDECSMRDADRVAQTALNCGANEAKLLINRVRPEYIGNGFGYNIDDMMDGLGIGLLGIVAEDAELLKNGGQAVGGDAAVCFRNIAGRLCGERIPIFKFEKKGFFARLFGR